FCGLGTAKNRFNLAAISFCLFDAPLRQETRVNQDVRFLNVNHWTMTQPVEQSCRILSSQKRTKHLPLAWRGQIEGGLQQVDVMVAQNRYDLFSQLASPSQYVQRPGAAVAQITYQP